jgi:superfamily II DNA or RNA helicase
VEAPTGQLLRLSVEARVQELQCPLREGDRVEARGEEWVLARIDPRGRCTLVTLRGCGPGNAGETCELVTPFDEPRVRRRRMRWQPASRASALRAAATVAAEAHPDASLRAAARARMTLLPWQLAPALAIVAGHPRVLVADEVGLGKTIQAALVVAELRARGEAARALVLTPAGLRTQWVEELRERCGLDAVLVDQARLAHDRGELPRDVNPWRLHWLMVTSIDLVRQPEVLGALEDLPLDVLIVDEAHHATPGTDRGHAVARLAAHALRVVLLTATPHAGHEGAYRALCAVGELAPPAPPLVFRRTQAGVGLALPRRTHVLPVAPSRAEAELFAALRQYLAWLARQGGGDTGVALLASVLTRRAASSPGALARTLARRRTLLGTRAPVDEQLLLPWDEPDAGDDCVPDHVTGVRLAVDHAREDQLLDALVRHAERTAAGEVSKRRALGRLLARIAEPAIVFTEYRDTLDELRPWLERCGSVAVLHGGLARLDREEAVRSFTRGAVRWLLATDAGSEGLNLQARCRVAVNVEVPPGPTRFAQRAGRVSRLGQTRAVHVFTLVHAGGLDEPALARFDERCAAIDDALAPGRLSRHGLAEGFDRAATREAERLASARRLAGTNRSRHAGPRGDRVPCGLRARGSSAKSWRLVVSADARDDAGRLVETVVMGVTVTWRSVPPRRWRDIRAALKSVFETADPSRVFAARAAALEAERGRGHPALLARGRELLARASAGHDRHQASLFDDRAARAAASAARQSDERIAWWRSRVHRLEGRRPSLRFDPPALRAAYSVGQAADTGEPPC